MENSIAALERNYEVKLVRLRDITLHHLKLQNPDCTGEDLDALDHDIKVWVKNLLMTLEEIDAKAGITFVGDNDTEKRAIQTRC